MSDTTRLTITEAQQGLPFLNIRPLGWSDIQACGKASGLTIGEPSIPATPLVIEGATHACLHLLEQTRCSSPEDCHLIPIAKLATTPDPEQSTIDVNRAERLRWTKARIAQLLNNESGAE